MRVYSKLLAAAPYILLANAHAILVTSQGEQNSGNSSACGINSAVPRDCPGITCQQDTSIIRQAEMDANLVNQCGRTQLTGNIDVGDCIEQAIVNNSMTTVTKGGKLSIVMHQVNADGAGPFVCDIDETGNTASNIKKLEVLQNAPGANGQDTEKATQHNIELEMPKDLNCTGGSNGKTCTVRCMNNALAGPFGGCVPVLQGDTDETVNEAAGIRTAQSAESINKQILINQASFDERVGFQNAFSAPQALQAALKVSELNDQNLGNNGNNNNGNNNNNNNNNNRNNNDNNNNNNRNNIDNNNNNNNNNRNNNSNNNNNNNSNSKNNSNDIVNDIINGKKGVNDNNSNNNNNNKNNNNNNNKNNDNSNNDSNSNSNSNDIVNDIINGKKGVDNNKSNDNNKSSNSKSSNSKSSDDIVKEIINGDAGKNDKSEDIETGKANLVGKDQGDSGSSKNSKNNDSSNNSKNNDKSKNSKNKSNKKDEDKEVEKRAARTDSFTARQNVARRRT